MDWLIGITLCVFIFAGIMVWRVWKIKKDVSEFANQVEKNLDAVLSGKEIDEVEATEDTLLGKVNEKLRMVVYVWRRKEEETLQQKQQMKELISDISHQTKTPIANQKIYLDILRQETSDIEILTFLDKLEHQTDKLDFLFRSMVKMSRLENGIIQIDKRKEDLRETVGRAVSSIVPSASEKKIEIFVKAKEALFVPHDKKWTEEAIYNLLDNAVKYTPNGGKIYISVVRREIFTEIHVKDTGKGIPIGHQAQIFRRFYREPEVHDKEGIGIGLYLVRKITELQKGYVEVKSEVGKGSDFQIYLPNA